MKYKAFEHANGINGKRWYVAQEDSQGFHHAPTVGSMPESAAQSEAALHNCLRHLSDEDQMDALECVEQERRIKRYRRLRSAA